VDRYIDATFTKLDRLSSEVHFQQILRFVETRLTDDLATLDLYARVLKGSREKDQATLAHAELKLSGLVKRDDEGVLVVRNRLYKHLFDAAWVDSTKPKRTIARTRRYAVAASVALLLTVGGGIAYQTLVVAPEVSQLTQELSVRGTFKDCAECPEMVVVPAGSFTMGSPEGEGNTDEHPEHTVTIPNPFAVSKYEITRGEYARFVESSGYAEGGRCWGRTEDASWRDPGFEQTDTHPAVCVSWQDARAYTEWLSRQTRRDYRLLTEAEWEYVTRAGTATRYWWGDDVGRNNANCWDCGSQWDHKGTAPVGSFRPNAFGLYDVHGNVWEWVADCYEKDAYKTHRDYPAMVGGWQDSCGRVLRGGSWFNGPDYCRSAGRVRDHFGDRIIDSGFRVARTL
jgi:formylglycine-generating enzyme required for sulfatase activity